VCLSWAGIASAPVFRPIATQTPILSRLLTKYEASDNARALAQITQMSPAAWRHILLNGHHTFQSDAQDDRPGCAGGRVEVGMTEFSAVPAYNPYVGVCEPTH
jgi:hypothetical protein